MKQLIIKDFEILVLGKILIYKQLTLLEAIEWDFFMKGNKVTVGERADNFLKVKLNIKDTKGINLMKFYEVYCDTALRGFYSNKGGNSEGTAKSIPSAGLVWIAQELRLDPLTMLERYTPEALDRLSDGVIRNKNAESEKGQEVNSRKLLSIELSDGDKELDLKEIQEMRDRKKTLSTNQS